MENCVLEKGRPQLKPGTSHQSTRYEIECWDPHGQQWWLRNQRKDLTRAKKVVADLRKARPTLICRIVVVSETRRLADG